MNYKVHILLIEDDKKITNFLSLALHAKGYLLSAASSGNEGILIYCTRNPDIIILDLGLPDMDGNEVIAKIREVSRIPILVVTARDQERDIVTALDLGANDYVTKPFKTEELLARIRVMERFAEQEKDAPQDSVYHFWDLVVDTQRHRVFLKEEELHLTPQEYKLLCYLAKNAGKVITHGQIMRDVWGYAETGDTKSIRVYVNALRRKLESEAIGRKYIITEIGVGYRFVDPQ